MEKLKIMEEREYSVLMRVLFGLDTPTPVARDLNELSEGFKDLEFFDPTLNESQRDAIKFALASREVALIHGPPGVSYQLAQDLAIATDSLLRPVKHTL